MNHWLLHWLGMDNLSGAVYGAWSGWGGDLAIVASVVTVLRRLVKNHGQRLAQSAQHHRELLEQHRAHHEELKLIASRHHHEMQSGVGQLIAQADANAQKLEPPPRKPSSRRAAP
jgi:hypothetical protein